MSSDIVQKEPRTLAPGHNECILSWLLIDASMHFYTENYAQFKSEQVPKLYFRTLTYIAMTRQVLKYGQ